VNRFCDRVDRYYQNMFSKDEIDAMNSDNSHLYINLVGGHAHGRDSIYLSFHLVSIVTSRCNVSL
jgi:hypothetical protein